MPGPAKLPPRWLLTLLALSGTAAIGMHFQSLFGRSPGVALLTLLFSLKLLETHSRRDAFAFVLLAGFVLISQFLYAQNLLGAVLMLLGSALIVSALALLERPDQTWPAVLRLSGQLLLQATPFMVLLFLLFPRIQTPLWGLPADAFSRTTGLSDEMSPGSISLLSQSDNIAFRASFSGGQNGATPHQTQLYWRGLVLHTFDGRTWRIGPPPALLERLPAAPPGPPVEYTVTLEPHNKDWLFALERPASLPNDARLSTDGRLIARQPVRSRLRYEMRSVLPAPNLRAPLSALSPAELTAALQLPDDYNPRTRALASQWRRELGNDDAALAQRLLEWFRHEDFHYTLRPPLLGEDSVDDFLFNTRRGFCEHYAGAFVFTLRAAGIPARVVTGYQGGEINPIDHTLIVRQSDAHAWAEIWLPGRGWRRVDPTAAVAPSRVERNLAEALPAGEPLPFLARPAFSWLQGARHRWDALANAWNQWVIGYNPQRQRSLLAHIGLQAHDWRQMAALLGSLGGTLLLAYTAWALYQRPSNDPALRQWQRFCQRLARRQLARSPWEGPQDYARRVIGNLQDKPALAREVAAIAALYERLRYAAPAADTATRRALLTEMKQRIRRLPLK